MSVSPAIAKSIDEPKPADLIDASAATMEGSGLSKPKHFEMEQSENLAEKNLGTDPEATSKDIAAPSDSLKKPEEVTDIVDPGVEAEERRGSLGWKNRWTIFKRNLRRHRNIIMRPRRNISVRKGSSDKDVRSYC